MLFSTSISVFFTATLLSTITLAAPTRTNCQCTIVSDAPSPAQYTPSTAHWMPSDPSPSSSISDACAPLGPKLDVFRLTEPGVYNTYLRLSKVELTEEGEVLQPIPTTVLLAFAAHRQGHQKTENATERDSSQPAKRIVCRSAPSQLESDQDSILNLLISQIIIAVAILACAAEGIHIGIRWMNSRNKSAIPPSERSCLRLPGGEKRLLAIPPLSTSTDMIASSDAEKKARAYATVRFFVTQASNGRREFIAYDDEDDDEANRPVM
ncbi:hypothetical protein NX059_005681 [Plenodomus lindquistii]|nr:hypothetical protein NX059_005681 [Plenodomus lindquistii]